MFGRATIRLGIGPHSSDDIFHKLIHMRNSVTAAPGHNLVQHYTSDIQSHYRLL